MLSLLLRCRATRRALDNNTYNCNTTATTNTGNNYNDDNNDNNDSNNNILIICQHVYYDNAMLVLTFIMNH